MMHLAALFKPEDEPRLQLVGRGIDPGAFQKFSHPTLDLIYPTHCPHRPPSDTSQQIHRYVCVGAAVLEMHIVVFYDFVNMNILMMCDIRANVLLRYWMFVDSKVSSLISPHSPSLTVSLSLSSRLNGCSCPMILKYYVYRSLDRCVAEWLKGFY